ncbi:hypothetical protein GCM10010478_66340 [Streptomyces erythrogriseus]|uniref:Uncharacterized protein n=2 Tax=Streptomyces griseoincarnatus group TaxID=2867193 RepID=A0ABP6K3D0_9ACTN|nr:hypothetical protein GCM10010265_51560 [Streptomyces griseoincarnatus]GGT65633.1 hypothetical protein GCM10010287_45270 [Streptomyces variabilis]
MQRRRQTGEAGSHDDDMVRAPRNGTGHRPAPAPAAHPHTVSAVTLTDGTRTDRTRTVGPGGRAGRGARDGIVARCLLAPVGSIRCLPLVGTRIVPVRRTTGACLPGRARRLTSE